MRSLTIAAHLIRRTVNGWRGLLFYVCMPIAIISLIITLFGQQSGKPVTIDYVNLDKGPLGEQLLMLMEDGGAQLSFTERFDVEQMKEDVRDRKVEAAFIIPAAFSESVLQLGGDQVEMLELRVSEASALLRSRLDVAASQLIFAASLAQEEGAGQRLVAVQKILENAEQRTVHAAVTDYGLYPSPSLYLVIGFLLMFAMMMMNGSVNVVLEDRARLTMARMFVAPVRAWEIALGNFLGMLLLGTLQIAAILLLTKEVFRFDYGVGFWPLLLVLEGYLLSILGLTSAIGALARSSASASSLNSLLVTPMSMLGGCWWPLEIMPEFLQTAANFTPQKWTIEAVYDLAGGAQLADIWVPLTILTLSAVVLLGFGSALLRPGDTEVT